jgi:threonyl-tRNA synthetase
MATLIEHTAGEFPVWLCPVQVAIVPVRENHEDMAKEIADEFKKEDIRIEVLSGNDSLGKRINHAKAEKIPFVIVIGDKEKEAGKLTVEVRAGLPGEMGAMGFFI